MATISPPTDTTTQDPFTPIKPTHRDSRLQSSPFSDYFTDDGRSADDTSTAPSPEKRQLLVRLNSLQSQLMHGDTESERQTMDIVQRKMHEIESQLNALHSQTRMPPEMEDSGLFMEEDDDEEEEEEEADGRKYKVDSRISSLHDQVTAEQKQAESDFLLLESQRVLESVSKANEQLRQRLVDTKALHEQHARDLESRDQEIATLRGENEALRTDLEFDHSELLFLQLQFKALEVEVSALDHGAQRLESYAPEIKEDIQRVKRERIAEEMGKWRRDWEEVDARMGRRRRRYLANSEEIGASGDADEEWRLETVKDDHGNGKVQSITIQRMGNGEGQTQDTESGADISEANSQQALSSRSETEYADTSTQTEPPSPVLLFDPEHVPETNIIPADDDCAITTSSEDNSPHLSDDDRNENENTKTLGPLTSKTAWQELWEGLAGFAGMAEERFD